MKKMTAEALETARLVAEANPGLRWSPRAVIRMLDHIAALEAEAAQARGRALEEAAECAVRPGWKTRECDEVAADIRALKSKPAQEASKKPRREHEYGEEYKGDFGTLLADCVHDGCRAYRISSRGKHHIHFKQNPDARPTLDPGPCEVEP